MSQAKQSSSDAGCRPSSVEDSPANLTALQESVSRLVMSVISGENSPESFGKLNRDGSWVKTSQGSAQASLDGSLEEFCETWPRWGILSGGVVGRLPTPERRTTGNGCSLWPTPVSSQADRPIRPLAPSERTLQHGVMLCAAIYDSLQEGPIRIWPTPQAFDAKGVPNGNAVERRKKGGCRNLSQEVHMWPTPTSRDHKDGSAAACRNVPVNGLLGRAVHYPTPHANCSTGAGQRGTGGPNLQTAVGGTLNPLWVELLMGFPPGWTDMEGE